MRRAFSALNGYQYEDAYKEQVKPPHSKGFRLRIAMPDTSPPTMQLLSERSPEWQNLFKFHRRKRWLKIFQPVQ
jgi:hypothetical protein